MAEISLRIGATDDATPKIVNLEGAVSALKGAVTALGIAWAAHKLLSYAEDAALMAARYHTLGAAMTVVGNNAGYTSDQMAAYQKTLQSSGIAMMEARQTLTMMASAHIDLANSAKLARIAQDAAVIGGINSSEAFKSMVYGIQSAQVEVLRTIGLNVNFEDSYKKLGKQLGKNAEDLTEMEKVQARTNAVMEKGKDIAGAYEAAMGTAGKQITSMQRYMDDLKVKVGEVFQDTLTVAVDVFTQGLKKSNGEMDEMAQKNQIDTWGKNVLMIFATVADAVYIVYNVMKTLVVTAVAGFSQMYYGAKAVAQALTGDFRGASDSFSEMMASGKAWVNMLADDWKTATPFQDAAKKFLVEKEAAKGRLDALKAEEAARIKAGEATRAEQAAKEAAAQAEKKYLQNLKNSIDGVKDYISASKDLRKEIEFHYKVSVTPSYDDFFVAKNLQRVN